MKQQHCSRQCRMQQRLRKPQWGTHSSSSSSSRTLQQMQQLVLPWLALLPLLEVGLMLGIKLSVELCLLLLLRLQQPLL
jgi:hypothetical protein